MENLRERARREQESTHKYAVGNFAKELLDVADNLRRALSTSEVGGKGESSDNSATASTAFKVTFYLSLLTIIEFMVHTNSCNACNLIEDIEGAILFCGVV